MSVILLILIILNNEHIKSPPRPLKRCSPLLYRINPGSRWEVQPVSDKHRVLRVEGTRHWRSCIDLLLQKEKSGTLWARFRSRDLVLQRVQQVYVIVPQLWWQLMSCILRLPWSNIIIISRIAINLISFYNTWLKRKISPIFITKLCLSAILGLANLTSSPGLQRMSSTSNRRQPSEYSSPPKTSQWRTSR